jgi:putative nucleotidyltransferase with HDIG domain
MHSLSKVTTKNTSKISEVLDHSLYCAFIARRAAPDLGLDPEESFVCGLMHDIGKTVLLNIAADYPFSEDTVARLLEEFHQRAGALLVLKWNFSDIIWSTVLYHHTPWDAPSNTKMAEAVRLADSLAHDSEGIYELLPRFTKIAPTGKMLKGVVDDLPAIRDTIGTL